MAATTKPMLLTLDDAIMLSLRNNPEYITKKLQQTVNKFQVVIEKNKFEPQYSFSGDSTFTRNVSNHVVTQTHEFNANGEISLKNKYGTTFTLANGNKIDDNGYFPTVSAKVEQPLIRGFGSNVVESALRDAIDQEKSQKLTFKNDSMSLIAQVTTDYFELYKAKQNLLIEKSTLKRYKQTLKNDQIKIAAGSMAKFDVLQPQSDIASAKADIQKSENDIRNNRLILLKTLGLKLDAKIIIPKKLPLEKIIKRLLFNKTQPPSENKCQQLALANNIGYQIEGLTLETAKRTLLVAKDALKWQLDLTAEKAWNTGTLSGLSRIWRNHDTTVGLKFAVPINDITSKTGYLAARIGLQQSRINYQDEKRQLQIDVIRYRFNVVYSKKQIELSKQAVELQRKNLGIATLKRSLGKMSSLDLSQQQDTLQSRQQALLESEISYISDLQTLDQQLGLLLDVWDVKIKD
jgi:outer membrane protein TolC